MDVSCATSTTAPTAVVVLEHQKPARGDVEQHAQAAWLLRDTINLLDVLVTAVLVACPTSLPYLQQACVSVTCSYATATDV